MIEHRAPVNARSRRARSRPVRLRRWTAPIAAPIAAIVLAGVGIGPAALADASPDAGPTAGGTTVTVSLPRIVGDQLATGAYHAAALGFDGEVYVWGANWTGQLGNGALVGTGDPVPPGQTPAAAIRPSPVTRWTAVFAGLDQTIAIGQDPTLVYAWGNNFGGQLATDAVPMSSTPVPIDASAAGGFTKVAVGDLSMVALGVDGRLWAWGDNSTGQLGTDDPSVPSPSLVPVQVPLPAGASPDLRFLDVRAGMALGDDGRVYTWGYGAEGQLGDGTTPFVRVALGEVALPPGVRVVEIAQGGARYALDADGVLWSWGSGFGGLLGNGSTASSALPVQVLAPAGAGPGFRWTSVTAGGTSHALAVGSDGLLYAWGSNAYGELGDGTTTQREAPVAVAAPAGADPGFRYTAAAGGEGFTILGAPCGLMSLGRNELAQLGNGGLVDPGGLGDLGGPLGDLELLGVAFDGLAGQNSVSLDCATWQLDTPAHVEGPVDVALGYRSGPSVQPVLVLPDAFRYGTAPVVTADPVGVSAAVGADVAFAAAGSGDSLPSVQWERSIGGGSWVDIPGATADTLLVEDLTPGQDGERYRAVYSNGLGTATSLEASLTVLAAPAPPSDPTDPTDSARAASLARTGDPVSRPLALAAGALVAAGLALLALCVAARLARRAG